LVKAVPNFENVREECLLSDGSLRLVPINGRQRKAQRFRINGFWPARVTGGTVTARGNAASPSEGDEAAAASLAWSEKKNFHGK
jgi:hypothetical protein